MNKLEFAKELLVVSNKVKYLSTINERTSNDVKGFYCTKYHLDIIIGRCFDSIKECLIEFIEESDIRYLGDNDLDTLKEVLIESLKNKQ